MGSLFAGIGGFDLGAERAGIKVKWNVEIDDACRKVLGKHFPPVDSYWDVREIDGGRLEPVDIITGGSPCQDLSVAGQRKGFGGLKSNLFYEMARIVNEMRTATEGKYPRYVLWENVPGALSTNGGEDFRTVLCLLLGQEVPKPKTRWQPAGVVVGKGSLAWRILDAQYFGVPQRRKRIFLIRDFSGGSAGEILFERKMCEGDTDEGVESRTAPALPVGEGAGSDSVDAGESGGGGSDGEATGKVLSIAGSWSKRRAQQLATNDDGKSYALCAGDVHRVMYAYDMSHYDAIREYKDKTYTLSARAGTGGQQVPIVLNAHDRHHEVTNDMTMPLTATHCKQPMVVSYGVVTKGNGDAFLSNERHMSLSTGGGQAGQGYPAVLTTGKRNVVRKLMPIECERIMGFPDGWTDGLSDSARYRLLGNAVVVPVTNWIFQRILKCHTQTKASNEQPSIRR
jgi:DNA (cytosine-5)-methyltransferase 1